MILSIAFTVLSIIGTIANIYKKQWCFILWLITNAFWIGYDYYHGLYAQAALFAVYFGLAVWGLVKWGRGNIHG